MSGSTGVGRDASGCSLSPSRPLTAPLHTTALGGNVAVMAPTTPAPDPTGPAPSSNERGFTQRTDDVATKGTAFSRAVRGMQTHTVFAKELTDTLAAAETAMQAVAQMAMEALRMSIDLDARAHEHITEIDERLAMNDRLIGKLCLVTGLAEQAAQKAEANGDTEDAAYIRTAIATHTTQED